MHLSLFPHVLTDNGLEIMQISNRELSLYLLKQTCCYNAGLSSGLDSHACCWLPKWLQHNGRTCVACAHVIEPAHTEARLVSLSVQCWGIRHNNWKLYNQCIEYTFK